MNCRITDSIKSEQVISIAVFSMFSAWMISLPYEGQILYALAEHFKIDIGHMVRISIAAHIAGLLCCGFFIKTEKAAKNSMIASALLCIAGSCIFFFDSSVLWIIVLPLISCVAGCWIASWGFFFKSLTPKGKRSSTAAYILVLSNFIMTVINIAAIYISTYTALVTATILLAATVFLSVRLTVNDESETSVITPKSSANSEILFDSDVSGIQIKRTASYKPRVFLCIFIFIVSINSGFMFQIVNPSFAHLTWLTSWYWVIPYILSILLVNCIKSTSSRVYILFVAIAMNGLSFIVFMAFGENGASYIAVDTLLLASCGIFDLFWWSILGEMLDSYKNPARILGIGLSANVGGILFGETIANISNHYILLFANISLIALAIVCLMIVFLPLLFKCLSNSLPHSDFLDIAFNNPCELIERDTEQKAKWNVKHEYSGFELTEREKQVALLLVRGDSYKTIADKLNISENTVKTHVKNIYSKMNIQNRAELINLFIITNEVKK